MEQLEQQTIKQQKTTEVDKRYKADKKVEQDLYALIQQRGLFWSYLIPKICRRQCSTLKHKTMAVTIANGQIYFYYDPDFVLNTIQGTTAEYLHEFYHIVLRHFERLTKGIKEIAELACECAVNSFLTKEKFSVIPIFPANFDLPNGHTAEWYYNKLLEKANKTCKSMFGQTLEQILNTPQHQSEQENKNDPNQNKGQGQQGQKSDSGQQDKNKQGNGQGQDKNQQGQDNGQGNGQSGEGTVQDSGQQSKTGEGSGQGKGSGDQQNQGSGNSSQGKNSGQQGQGQQNNDSTQGQKPGQQKQESGQDQNQDQNQENNPNIEQAVLSAVMEKMLKGAVMFDNYEVAPENTIENQEIVKQTITQVITRTEEAARTRGIQPGDDFYIIQKMYSHEVKWHSLLRNFIGTQLGGEYRTYWSKIDKRFNDYPGKKEQLLPRLTIGIDTSGSISDAELCIFAAEINHLRNIYDTDFAKIIEFDSAVNRVYKLKRKIQKVKGRGGTEFSCCLKEAEKLKSDVCVIFTDGYGESEGSVYHPKRTKVIWVVKDPKKNPANFGKIIRFDAVAEEED